MLEGEENTLLESGLSHNVRHKILFFLHVLLPQGCDPLDEGSALGSERAPPANRHHEVFLLFTSFVEVSPSAEVVTELELGLPIA